MDTSSLLVSHPRPFPAESLSGYVLRLSEVNGYMSPWTVLGIAGYEQTEFAKQAFSFEKLSSVINWSARNQGPFEEKFLVPSLQQTEAHFCPECVVEKFFIEAHWSLPLMVGCPTHKRQAATKCPGCNQPITWYRRGLLECNCGSALGDLSLPEITDAEATLLDLIRSKVLGIAPANSNPADLPLRDLAALDLDTLLQVIATIAKHQRSVIHSSSAEDNREIIQHAAHASADWPRNFIVLLEEYAHACSPWKKSATTSRCLELYRSVFGQTIGNASSDTDFLLGTIVEYAVKEWQYLDPCHMERFARRLPAGLLGPSQFRTQIEKSRNASLREITMPNANSPLRSEVKMSRMEIAKSEYAVSSALGRQVASERLGISPIVLQILVDDGTCKAHQLPGQGTVFLEVDIQSLRESLLALAPQKPRPSLANEQCVPLSAALSWEWDSPFIKAALIRGLLDRRVEIVANLDGSIGGLQLDRQAYHQFVGALRSSPDARGIGAKDASKLLRCDRATVPGIVQLGALSGCICAGGLRISSKSIDEFQRSYTFLSPVAKTLHTNTARLAGYCDILGIAVNCPERGNRKRVHLFIRLQDSERLIEEVLKARAAEAREARQKASAPRKTAPKDLRYWEMVFPGSPRQRFLDRRAAVSGGQPLAVMPAKNEEVSSIPL